MSQWHVQFSPGQTCLGRFFTQEIIKHMWEWDVSPRQCPRYAFKSVLVMKWSLCIELSYRSFHRRTERWAGGCNPPVPSNLCMPMEAFRWATHTSLALRLVMRKHEFFAPHPPIRMRFGRRVFSIIYFILFHLIFYKYTQNSLLFSLNTNLSIYQSKLILIVTLCE